MPINRREFLLSAAAVAAAPRVAFPAGAATDGVFPASVRENFPAAASGAYFNSAAHHPLGLHARRAIDRYLDYRVHGDGQDFGAAEQAVLKRDFAAVINARADEIAFCQSTSDAENIVVFGMDLPRRGGNVVVDDLHFTTSLYMYKALEEQGLEVRVVKHRDWAIDTRDVERAVDRNTRLVSMALVSNVNGFMHDVRTIAGIAHAHGAYLYADAVQAVGAVPVDVRAMGIDFLGTSIYKWLMGERGFGYLYVREDLQDAVLPTTRYGHRHVREFDRERLTWTMQPGGFRYETGQIPNALAAGSQASLEYIAALGGLPKIRAHAKQLTERLQEELPARGYPSLTPPGTETPIVAFRLTDAAATSAKLRQAGIAVTIVPAEQRMRVSVSVFNTHDDVDRLVSALRST